MALLRTVRRSGSERFVLSNVVTVTHAIRYVGPTLPKQRRRNQGCRGLTQGLIQGCYGKLVVTVVLASE